MASNKNSVTKEKNSFSNKNINVEQPNKTTKRQKIVFLGSEVAPFIATGGLSDVLGSLPKELAKNKRLDISVFLPLYSNILEEYRHKFRFLTNFEVSLSWRKQYAGVFLCEDQNVKYYFIDNEYYFKREGNIYGQYDDAERFAFFSRASLDALSILDIYPDVLHCNDWQTAPAIIYLKGMYYGDEKYRKIKTIFTIHNIEYQGKFSMQLYDDLFGFSQENRQYIEFNGELNLMKGAIEMTDIVSTVSPTYANEIKHAFFAHGLENIVIRNEKKLTGILNGIDIDYYNPETDKCLFENYSHKDLSGKAVCKLELQKLLSLPQRQDVPIIAIISRLVSHKGLDLVRQVLESILCQDVQVVVLGKGETVYENYFTHISHTYQGKCATVIAYNQDLSRKIYSGADMFLMPSKSEPCGLAQMIASRYGTVPIVRETGGLNDSIKAYTGSGGNGFTFANYNAHDMLYVVNEAIKTYHDKNAWGNLQQRVMLTDFSWKNQAKEYLKLYSK